MNKVNTAENSRENVKKKGRKATKPPSSEVGILERKMVLKRSTDWGLCNRN